MSTRLPTTLWRVVATGGTRAYWEPASKTYAAYGWAARKAADYRRQGAATVEIFRADLDWQPVPAERAWSESEAILADLGPALDESRRRRIARHNGGPAEAPALLVSVRELPMRGPTEAAE